MLKITLMSETDETVTLKLEGRIIGQWVNEIGKEFDMWLTNGKQVVLDLSGVIFIGELGIETIKAMKRNGVKLIGCSLFLSGLLEENF